MDPVGPGEESSSVDRELRRRAEGLLRGEKSATEPATALEASALLHELRVREIELEMQNEELRRAQEELGASRAKYFELFDLAPVGYVTLDEAGLIREANLTAAGLLGAKRERLAGKPLDTFVLAEDRDLLYRCHHLAVGGEHQVCELRLCVGGEQRWVRLEEALIESEGDAAAVFSIAMSDVTAQKVAEDARTRIAAVVDSSEDAILTKTLEGEIVTWNAGAERIYGYAPEEIIGRPVSVLTPPDSDEQLAMLLGRIARGTPVEHYETVRLRKDGTPVDVSLSISPIRDAGGAIIGAATIARDVSARHRAEEALREVEERYASLFANMLEGVAYCRMLYDEDGRPADFVYLQVNPAFERLTGLADVIGKRFNELIPTAQAETPELLETYGRVARTGEPAEFDIDFTPLDLYLHVTVFRPEPDHFVAVFADVGEQKRAALALRESEARYRGYFEQSLVGVAVSSPEKGWLDVNEATCELLGYGREELSRLTWAELTHPDDLAADLTQFERVVAGEVDGYRLEKRFLRKDGAVVDVDMSVRCARTPDGSVDYFLALLADVTERKEAEAALRASEEQNRALFENMAQGVVYQDAEGHITAANSAAERILGLSLAQMQGVTSTDPRWRTVREDGSDFPGEEHPAMVALRTGQPVHDVVCGVFNPADEAYHWIKVSAAPQFGPGEEAPYQVFATFEDVTEIRAAADALREGEERYRSLFESLTEGVALHELVLDEEDAPADYRILAVNPAFTAQTGMSAEAVCGKLASEAYGGGQAPFLEQYAGATLSGEPARFQEHFAPLGRDFDITAVRQSEGHFATLFEDVTERRRAEQALREATDRLALATRAGGVGVWDWDLATDVLTWDEQMFALYGIRREQFAGAYEAWQAGLHPDDRERGDAEVQAALRGEKEYDTEFRVLLPDGSVHDIRALAQVQRDEAGAPTHIIGTNWDITERKRAEEDVRRLNEELEERVVRRTAQLEAANKELEAFVYSAAHDLRAPLRAIDGFSQMVFDDAGEKLSAADREHLQRARAAAQRMALLIDALMGLARASRQEMLIEEVDVSALASAVVAELAEAEPGRAVTTVVAPGMRARADAALLRSILGNLLSNAWKFTSKHERARIEVGLTDAGGEQAFFVRDDGAGFDPAYAAHLFGAFQRMHEAGLFEGDGIGLATVQRLVNRQGGRVWAEAAVETGATFYFTLPGVTGAV